MTVQSFFDPALDDAFPVVRVPSARVGGLFDAAVLGAVSLVGFLVALVAGFAVLPLLLSLAG